MLLTSMMFPQSVIDQFRLMAVVKHTLHWIQFFGFADIEQIPREAKVPIRTNTSAMLKMLIPENRPRVPPINLYIIYILYKVQYQDHGMNIWAFKY